MNYKATKIGIAFEQEQVKARNAKIASLIISP